MGVSIRVLVSDDFSKATLGIVRSLGRKGFYVGVLADSDKRLASLSRYCGARHLVPSTTDADYIDAISQVLHRHSYDVLLPVQFTSTLAVARNQERLKSLVRLGLPSFDKICTAASKKAAIEIALSLGIPVPRSNYPKDMDEAAHCGKEVTYPVVLKASTETPGYTVNYANNSTELLAAYRVLWDRNGRNGNAPMVQEFIPGQGFGFFALYQDGECKRVFMHRRIRENPPTGGASTCASSYYDPKLKEYGRRLLEHLQWHGVAMVEFRLDSRDGQYKLMEINPKFWGSLDLALAAGVDFPFLLCRMAMGENIGYSEEYARDLRYHWPFSGELQHLSKRPRALLDVLGDSVNPKVKSNVCLHDLRPNLNEGVLAMRALMRKIGSN